MKFTKIIYLFVLVGLFVTFNACQKEDDHIVKPELEQRKITKELVSFDEIKHNEVLFKLLNDYKERKKIRSKSIVHDSINDFYIETSEAIYIEEGDYHSYTFSIFRDSPGSVLENLVLSLLDSGDYHISLWKYAVDNNGNVDYNVPVEAIELEGVDDGILLSKSDPLTGCSAGQTHYVEVYYEDASGNQYDYACDECLAYGEWVPCPNQTGGSDSGSNDSGSDSGSNDSGSDGSNDNGSNDTGGDSSSNNGSNDVGDGNQNSGQSGNGNGTSSPSGGDGTTVITAPKKVDGSNASADFLITQLGLDEYDIQDQQIIDWINNTDIVYINLLSDILYLNNNTLEAQVLVLDYIDILIDFTSNFYQNNPTTATQHLVDFIRLYGENDLDIVADYYEALITDFPSMSFGNQVKIYLSLKVIADEIPMQYFNAILSVYFTDLVIPLVTQAFFEFGINAFTSVLQRIPVSMLMQGTRLNKWVIHVSKLGVQGDQAHVRIVTTTQPVTKAQELFNTLTTNAISISEVAPGVTKATMGNGNFITFRTVSQSGFPATIDLNFPLIFGQTIKVIKFASP